MKKTILITLLILLIKPLSAFAQFDRTDKFNNLKNMDSDFILKFQPEFKDISIQQKYQLTNASYEHNRKLEINLNLLSYSNSDPTDFPRPKITRKRWYNSSWFYITTGVLTISAVYFIVDSSGKTSQSPLPFPPNLPD